MQIDDAPDAVIRYKKGYCGQCWDQMQNERPPTPEELRAADSLDAFIARRRDRIERRERESKQREKQLAETGKVEVRIDQPIRIPVPVIDDEKPVPAYRKPRATPKGRKLTLDYSYPNGTIHLFDAGTDLWCYVIKSTDGEVLGKNDYGYRALKHAKLVAKTEAGMLGWDIS